MAHPSRIDELTEAFQRLTHEIDGAIASHAPEKVRSLAVQRQALMDEFAALIKQLMVGGDVPP
jgi:hypothetical protein